MSKDLKRGDIVDVTVKARVVNVGVERVEVYYDASPPRHPFIKDVRLVKRELKIGDRIRLQGNFATWIWLGSEWMLVETAAPSEKFPKGCLRSRDEVKFDEEPEFWTYIPVGEVEDE